MDTRRRGLGPVRPFVLGLLVLGTSNVALAQVTWTGSSSDVPVAVARAGNRSARHASRWSNGSQFRVAAEAEIKIGLVTWASSRSDLSARVDAAGASLSFFNLSRSSVPTTASTQVSGKIIFQIASPKRLAGRIICDLSGGIQRDDATTASGQLQLTVGNVSRYFLSAHGTRQYVFPVVVTPTGVPLTVFANAATKAASWSRRASAFATLRMRFVADPCTVLPYGSSCSAMQATSASRAAVGLRIQAGPRNGFGTLLVGVDKARLSTPYLGCFVLMRPLFTVGAFALQADGSGHVGLPLPKGKFDFLLQGFLAEATFHNVKTTNGIELRCLK